MTNKDKVGWFIVCCLATILGWILLGITNTNINFISCSSDRMYPNLYCGCMIVLKKVNDVRELNPSDIVSYRNLENGRYLDTIHRIISANGELVIVKGDNNGYAETIDYDRIFFKLVFSACPPYKIVRSIMKGD